MGIEIKPAAVAAMLDEKAWKLDKMKDTFSRSKEAMRQFVHDDTLKGAAYDAAKERFERRIYTIEAFELLVGRSKQIDSRFKSIIESYWGGSPEQSEDYWRGQSRLCLSQINKFENLKKQADDRVQADPANFLDRNKSIYYAGRIALWSNAKKIADDMVQKIINYCNETNNLYNDADLNALDASIGQAISAFNNAKFNPETKTWTKMDTSCFEGLSKNVEKVRDDYLCEMSISEDTWIVKGDYVYIDGKKYDLNKEEDFELVDSLKSTLLGKHVVDGAVVGILYDDKFGELIEVTFSKKGGKVLDAAGIKKLGKMKGSGFLGLGGKYVTFEGFEMKVGAQKMTTRCLRSNIGELSRPSAVRTASADFKISGVGKGIKTVAWPVTFAVGLWTASDAYNEEYASGEGLPEDLRRSNAEASAVCDVIQTGSSVGFGAAGAAIGTLICPGVGTVIGGFVGGIFGSYVANEAMKTDIDGDNKTLKTDIKEGWYKAKKAVSGS